MLNWIGSEKLYNTHHCYHCMTSPSDSCPQVLVCIVPATQPCFRWATEVEHALALQKRRNRTKAGQEPALLSWQPTALVHLNRNSSLHPLFGIYALHKKSQSLFSRESRNRGLSDHLHLQHKPLAYEKMRCTWDRSAQLETLTSQPWAVLTDYWQPGKTKFPCFLGSTPPP